MKKILIFEMYDLKSIKKQHLEHTHEKIDFLFVIVL